MNDSTDLTEWELKNLDRMAADKFPLWLSWGPGVQDLLPRLLAEVRRRRQSEAESKP